MPVETTFLKQLCGDVLLKDALKNFAEFTVLESLFDKVSGRFAYKFVIQRFQHRYFPVSIAKFLRCLF